MATYSDRQEPPVLANFVNAHALDLEPALGILCWVAGSSKPALKEVEEIGAIGVEDCPREFKRVSGNVTRELSPHLESGANLAPAVPAAKADA